MMNMDEQKRISLDRMRYTKNTLSSSLALCAIVFPLIVVKRKVYSPSASLSIS